MAVIPSHQPITTWQDWLDTHRHAGRITWPRQDRLIGELIVLEWFGCTWVGDGLPLSALVQAARTINDETWLIGIIWSETRPLARYPIPALWVRGRETVRL